MVFLIFCGRSKRRAPAQSHLGATPLVGYLQYSWKKLFNMLCFFLACAHAMDVAVLVDSSRTVGWSNFETLKRSLAKFTDYFHVSNEGTHFGFIHFKQGPVVDFDFGNSSFHNADALKQKIMGIRYDPGLSRMDQAMALANTKLFTDRGGMRKGVPKFLIVFTDGKYDEGSASYAGVLDSLKVRLFISPF